MDWIRLVIIGLVIIFVLLGFYYYRFKGAAFRARRLIQNLPEDKTITLGTTVDELLRREKALKIIRYILTYIFLVLVAIFIIIPFYWMLITALKSGAEVQLTEPTLFPKKLIFRNFVNAMTMPRANFSRYIWNTVVVGFFSTLGTLITTITAAFAFSRLSFRGRDTLFVLFLATMMIPGEMMVITNFITITARTALNWKNTYQAMIVPFWVTVFYIYLLRQTFKQIPNELYYAAKVDGTTDFKYLLKIMIPIGMPTIITISILKLMGAWNSYIWPNLVTEGDMRLITNGLRTAFTDEEGRASQHLQMAATTVVTLPLLLIFIFLRKYIMRGVSRSGIKG